MVLASDAALSVPDAIEVRTGRGDPVLTDAHMPASVLRSGADRP